MTYTYFARSEHDTDQLGAALAAVLTAGSVVGLNGTLGAGKTRLVQAVAHGLGIERAAVVSPTYVLVQEHLGHLPLFHFDAYRLRDDDEFLELGPDEYFSAGGVTIIEWAERVIDCLPSERLEIAIDVIDNDQRRFMLTALGASYEKMLLELGTKLTLVAQK